MAAVEGVPQAWRQERPRKYLTSQLFYGEIKIDGGAGSNEPALPTLLNIASDEDQEPTASWVPQSGTVKVSAKEVASIKNS